MMANYKRQPAYKAGDNGKPKKVSPYDDAQRVLNKGYQCTEIKDTMKFCYLILIEFSF